MELMALERSQNIWQVCTGESFRYITVYSASMLSVQELVIKTVLHFYGKIVKTQ